uniref:Retrotransposon gag domain-containing protein n=1 Tax=Nicotiana tabacum TaxID=4097 RepID=A0A1S4AJQ6_TOBAC|nr:PREDICTED: uncharacterized protein LOC107798412 [Nicotiana tabacum]
MAGDIENTVEKDSLDTSSPLYMHPPESAGSVLVPVAFDGTRYRSGGEVLADSLQYVNNAKELWQEFEDRCDQTNGVKLYQLQKEINDLSQGTLDVTGYYTKMKKLWEELNTLNAHAQYSCQCTCRAKTNMHKAE